MPKFGESTIDFEKVAVHWAAMTTPSEQIQIQGSYRSISLDIAQGKQNICK